MSISIVIPALNAEQTLPAQLQAIAEQSADLSVEVVVADNGSTDLTVAVAESFCDAVRMHVVDASARPGPAAARNLGVAAAAGDIVLFCDADDVVLPGWLNALSGCVAPGRIAVGAFRVVAAEDTEIPTDWQATRVGLPRYLGQVPLAYSSNLGVTRADFDRAGGFDETLRCGEDADLGIRMLALGCEVAWCPGARIVMRDRGSSRSQFRQFVEYGRWDVAVYRKHRGRALRRPPIRDAARDYASLVVHLPRLFMPSRRRSWVVTAGQRIGRLIGSARERTFLP